MSYKLNKPYTDKQRIDFIIKYNHKKGLNIKETETALYALEAWENLVDDNVIDNSEEFQQQKAQQEAKRIAMLNLTGADVERAIYKAVGMDFDDIISLIEAQPLSETGQPIIDIKALKIELKANNFYRGNEYIDQIGTLLGFTTKQLNNFFEAGVSEDFHIKNNAYKYLTNVTLTINTTPEDCIVNINNESKTSITIPYGEEVTYIVEKEGFETQSETLMLTEDKILNIELGSSEQIV